MFVRVEEEKLVICWVRSDKIRIVKRRFSVGEFLI